MWRFDSFGKGDNPYGEHVWVFNLEVTACGHSRSHFGLRNVAITPTVTATRSERALIYFRG